MKRRTVLKSALSALILARGVKGSIATESKVASHTRVRPGDRAWPSAAQWDRLKEQVGGRLFKPASPFTVPDAQKHMGNPYFIGDEPALTQTSGWLDAWQSQPSAYVVAAESATDVAAAVNFARERNLRLVVKGGGHSYKGGSCAPDSLLIWTRHMNGVVLHDSFVPQGCNGKQAPQPAVSVQSGAMWIDAYNAVTTHGGRYVQGGGCTTVGVAGLVQGGGFGSWSKNYGTAAAGLLEAEIVTADGKIRIANACTHADLFWALKGGGGGSFGVVTRLTLRTRELPKYFGVVAGEIRASSDEAFQALIAQVIDFYASALFNPHWGETIQLSGRNVLALSMVFQDLTQQEAEKIWAPFFDWVRSHPEYTFDEGPLVVDIPAEHFWDAGYFKEHFPGIQFPDDRPGSPADHFYWDNDRGQVGWFIHHYKSAWLPAQLLDANRRAQLVDALYACTRHWGVGLHFNKGMAGGRPEDIAAVRDTAMNPEVLDAFALAIIATGGKPAFAGMQQPTQEISRAHDHATLIGRAMDALRAVAPRAGAYVSESDYFQPEWQTAFWGTHYPRLAAVKRKYDPRGLFFVHHGVGSESWSADGFSRK
jgi:FAD/FMN-containing dehydrogenase